MKITLLISVILLTSCLNSNHKKFVIDKNTIDHIEIRKQNDSESLILPEDQIEKIVTQLENAEPLKPSKDFVDYHLIFQLKDGTTLNYTTKQNIVRAPGGYTYSLDDKDFFKKIWYQQVGLSDNYHEYFLTYNEDGEIVQYIQSLDSTLLVNLKQVFTDNGHQWVEIRGILFHEGDISKKQLVIYTSLAKSID